MKPGTRFLLALTVLTNLHQAVAQVAFAPATNYGVGKNPYSVVAADVNGDGKVDLICADEGDNKLMVLTNNGSGVFGSNATYAVFDYPLSIVAADVNGDGWVDLVCVCPGANGLMVLTNNGSGSFVNAGTYYVGRIFNGSFMVTDVNGDGMADLVYPRGGNVLTNAGNGMFVAAPSLPPAPGILSSCFAVAADVNGDGKTDLIDVDDTHSFS